MKLVKVEWNDTFGKIYKKTKLDVIIDEFIAMKTSIVEIEDFRSNYSSTSSCLGSFYNALRRRGQEHIKVAARDGKVYLVDTSRIDKE
jgi:hypothetical protein